MENGFAGEMLPREFSINRVIKETVDTFTLEMTPVDGPPELRFSPGQFNMIYAFGMGEVPVSISGDPGRADRFLHTIRSVGSVTKGIARLKKGDVLGVRGPFGKGWPLEYAAGSDIVIVAGGIGLAPLRPALYRIMAERGRYGKVALLYGVRTSQDILYRKEIEKLRGRFDVEVHVTVDRGTGGWKGNVGVVTGLISRIAFEPLSTVAFICGPELMMRFTVKELERREIDHGNLYLSMERNMKCGIGLCGHCQYGPHIVCRHGPVFAYSELSHLLLKREI